MAREKKASTSAKILYRPFGIVGSILAGVVSAQVFKQVWKRASAGEGADAPSALQSEYDIKQILVAAAVQGAVFAAVKALVDRAGARAFERWTGEWPGS